MELRAAGLIVVGFVAGSFPGARYVAHLSNATVTRIFAVFLIPSSATWMSFLGRSFQSIEPSATVRSTSHTSPAELPGS